MYVCMYVSDWVNRSEFKYICAIQVFEVIMFSCYISDAWKLCCLYVLLRLIIYFNEFSSSTIAYLNL